MAKLHFFYSSMNAGKTTHLLQANYNYINDGFNTLLIKPKIDNRFGDDKIKSRLGFEANALPIDSNESLRKTILELHKKNKINFILADEVQFFSYEQIHDLGYLADVHDITVMAYGLRNNFQGHLFEGSRTLFEISNNLTEIKKICHCGQKATMVLRYNSFGQVCREGAEVELGAEDKYVSVCRKDFFNGDIGNQARDSIQKNCNDMSLKQKNILMKEKHANIISKTMEWNFKTAMKFSESDVVVLFKKIEDEIEVITDFNSKAEKQDFIIRINNQEILSKLNITKVALLKSYSV